MRSRVMLPVIAFAMLAVSLSMGLGHADTEEEPKTVECDILEAKSILLVDEKGDPRIQMLTSNGRAYLFVMGPQKKNGGDAPFLCLEAGADWAAVAMGDPRKHQGHPLAFMAYADDPPRMQYVDDGQIRQLSIDGKSLRELCQSCPCEKKAD